MDFFFRILIFITEHRTKLFIALVLTIWFYTLLPSPLFDKPCSTVLIDEHDQLLAAQISKDGQWRFPESEKIPFKFEQCIIQFEDEYFYYHPGINPVSIFRSISNNFKAGKIKSGGSTITMQLARMARGNKPRNYFQKVMEMLLALRIELSYKKSSILRSYCSNAPYGSNVVGLSAASWRYFGRAPEKLSWAESALLAVLPNAPSLIYPGKNQKTLLLKRNRLLKKLHDKKIIDESTYHLSLQEGLPGKPFPIPQLAPHLLNRCVSEYGASAIYKTSIQKYLQAQVSAAVDQHVQSLSINGIHNACALVAETETGKIIAYVGNSSSPLNDHENFVDIIQAPRSTGSILKPFLYAFMLHDNKMLPKSLIEDIPTQIGSYGPKNFHLTYDGLVPANEAIARSLNVPAVKMLQEYGTPKFHDQLKKLGFTTFTKPSSHYGLSLILGGGEATLHQIASAYASMGRALMHYSNTTKKYAANSYHPLYYLRNEEARSTNLNLKSDLINASSVWFTFNAMTELLRPSDYVGWMQFLSRNKIAWKTGTSFGFRDAWAVGLDSKYTVAVWVGNADGEGRPELTGTSAAAPLMFRIFNMLPQKKWFTKPSSDIEKMLVCKQSGFKASEICPQKELTECPKGSSKTKPCPFHKLITLDQSGKYRVNSNCYPVSQMQQVPWFVATPAQEYFLQQHNLFYRSLPPYLNSCESELSVKQLDIIYPRNDFKIYAPVGESGQQKNIVLKATHKNATATLFWHIDGEYFGSTQKFHQLSVMPRIGTHTLIITDEEGETSSCKFEIIGKK